MPLSLQDIHDKQFHVRFRGFDIEEVDSFLEVIAENYAIIQDDNKKMSAQLETLTKELDRVKGQESSFRSAIISAQKIAEEMRTKSRDEADTLRKQALEEIKGLKDEAHKEVTELEARVEQLKGMKVRFEQDIRDVIASYLANLDGVPQPIKKEPEKAKVAEVAAEVAEAEAEVPEGDVFEYEDPKDKTPDFSDLYEKIDLDDDLTSVSMVLDDEEPGVSEEDAADFLKSGDTSQIPDLDSDLMFTLHDPLDDDEIGIDVPISGGKDGG